MSSDIHTEHRKNLLRGTGLVGILTLLSRIFGFVRDMLVARLFGTGTYADAFFVAFRIPNLLRSFVAEGALTSAFVPVFASELKHGREAANNALRSILSLLCWFTLLLTLLGIAFSPQIVAFFAPGFQADAQKFGLTVQLTQVMMPYIMCISVIALVNGALNSLHVYGASAVAQIVMNLVLIAGALAAALFDMQGAALVLSASVLIGGLAQIIAQVPALKRAELHLGFSRSIWSPASRSVVKLMLPALLGATIYQFNIFLSTLLASCIGEGAVSWLFYADRVTQLPIGIFTISLASVLLPNLSRAHAEGNTSAFQTSIIDSLRYTSFVILPVSTVLIVLAGPLVEVLFQRGAFNAESTQQTALAVQAYALGLWAVSCHSMLVRAFIAQKDTVTSTIVGLISLVVSFASSLLLIGPLPEAAGGISAIVREAQSALALLTPTMDLGHAGLALASSIASFVSLILIATLLSRRIRGISWAAFLVPTAKVIFVCLGMAACMRLCFSLSSPYAIVALALPVGIISFSLLAKLLGLQEFEETLRLIRRTISKSV
ncbi:MAG: murein biosynthesis integral membrane protein MurJ [Oligoflexia bacterium]|nr:murein biosynthesis integral membrane protein MurJ [Oligoflexia bacterium]